MLRTYDLNNHGFDELDPQDRFYEKKSRVIRSTYHTTNKASPGQLLFIRYMLFNITHITD